MRTQDLEDIIKCSDRFAQRNLCEIQTSLVPGALEISMQYRGVRVRHHVTFTDLDRGRLGPEGVYDHALMAAMAEIDKTLAKPRVATEAEAGYGLNDTWPGDPL